MHTFQITFSDAKHLCAATSTPLPGVGEFRKVSFRNIILHLNNTGHRTLQVSSYITPSVLFTPTFQKSTWSLRQHAAN